MVAVIVAVPTLATLNVVPLFVINTTAELSLTYENVPLLDEVGESVKGACVIVSVWSERPEIVGVPRVTVKTAEISLVKCDVVAAMVAVIVVSPTFLMVTVVPEIVATEVSLETYDTAPLEIVLILGTVKVPTSNAREKLL